MICESLSKRGMRPEVSDFQMRREATSAGLQGSRESVSESSTRSPERRAAGVGTFRNSSNCAGEQRQRLTKTRVARVINERRLLRISALPLDFIPNPQFSQAGAEKAIMVDTSNHDVQLKTTKIPPGLPPYLASLYEVPLLTREQEGRLFRKFNYLKYKAWTLRGQLDPDQAKRSVMDKIEQLHEAAVAVKNEIVRANLRLVVSLAKRYAGPNRDLWELISDGNVSLIQAVDKFDFTRGNKLSTYATWAIIRNFARAIPSEQRYQGRFRTTHDEILGTLEERRSDQRHQELDQRQRQTQVRHLLARLDEREQKIVADRFGLQHGQEPRTLLDIAAELGVSKERVRQIEKRAFDKLRIAAAEENIDESDF